MKTIKAELIETAIANLPSTLHPALAERAVNAVLERIVELTPSPRTVVEIKRIRNGA